jgi:hypothetical protein
MPGQSKTVSKIVNVLKWILTGLGVITAFIPGLQPVGALIGMTSGMISLATGVSNMIQQKQEGKLTTANKISNITDIIGGALGMISPVSGIIGSTATGIASKVASTATTVMNVVDKANTVVGMTASVPNTISQTFRGRDAYDQYMNFY